MRLILEVSQTKVLNANHDVGKTPLVSGTFCGQVWADAGEKRCECVLRNHTIKHTGMINHNENAIDCFLFGLPSSESQ